MRISDVFIQTGGVDALKKAAGTNKAASKSEVPAKDKKDSLSISSQARNMSETESSKQSAKLRASSLPDIRQEKVNEVREKIANGYYNSDEFKDKLADKLIKDFGL